MPKGIHSFSTQEAKNFSTFGDWNYQELDLRTLHTFVKADYITAANPAKQVIIYQKPGTGAGDGDLYTLFANDTLTDTGLLTNDASIGTADATFNVDSDVTTVVSVGDVVLMSNVGGAELMKVTAIGSTLIATLNGRGFGGTTATTHADDEKIYKVDTPSRWFSGGGLYPPINIDNDDMPFTLSGAKITSLYINNSGAESDDADDYLSVLSFH